MRCMFSIRRKLPIVSLCGGAGAFVSRTTRTASSTPTRERETQNLDAKTHHRGLCAFASCVCVIIIYLRRNIWNILLVLFGSMTLRSCVSMNIMYYIVSIITRGAHVLPLARLLSCRAWNVMLTFRCELHKKWEREAFLEAISRLAARRGASVRALRTIP